MKYFGLGVWQTYVVVLYVLLGLDFGKLKCFFQKLVFTYMCLFLCIVNTFQV